MKQILSSRVCHLLFLTFMIVSQKAFCQTQVTEVVSEDLKLIGGVETSDVKPEILKKFYKNSRSSSPAVSLALSKGKTYILKQEYVVTTETSQTMVHREVILQKSKFYGNDGDNQCAVKVTQLGSYDRYGNMLSAETYEIAITYCPNEDLYMKDKKTEEKQEEVVTNEPLRTEPAEEVKLTRSEKRKARREAKLEQEKSLEARERAKRDEETEIENKTHLETQSKDTQSIDRSIEVRSRELAKTVNQEELFFGKVNDEKIVFILDASTSTEEYRGVVANAIWRILSKLKSNQKFSVVVLNQENDYFNNGKITFANSKTIADAQEFISNKFWHSGNNSSGFEPIAETLLKIKEINGKVDRIYFMGDGDCTPTLHWLPELTVKEHYKVATRKSKVYLKTLELIQDYGVPFTIRTPFNLDVKDNFLKLTLDHDEYKRVLENYNMLKEYARVSGGFLITEGFTPI